jgi:pimeloyl-ACP methyl ester carboxylesterase
MTETRDASVVIRSAIAPDGSEIFYQVVGQGPTITFLHGSFVGRGAFTRQLSALGEQFRLLLITSRGHDGTDVTLPADFSFSTTEIEDVCAVLNAENVAQTHLVAHSTGGATAFALARDRPERVNRMVLIEPTLHQLLPTEVYQQVSQEASPIIAASEASDEVAAWQGMMEHAGGDKWRSLDETMKLRIVNGLRPLSPLLAPHFRQLLNFSVSEDDVRQLQAPTLLFYGDDSVFFEPVISARFASLRADILQIRVENSGHNVHHDQADLVNEEILKFFLTS